MKRLAVLALSVLLLAGCAARPIHPGAANKFDSDSYDALLVTDNVIQSTRTDLANNVFPSSIAPKVKESLNYLITSYNAADIAYKAYHVAMTSGNGASSAQIAAVTTSLNQVSAATSTLVNAKAGH